MKQTAGRWLAIPRSRWSLRMRVIAATLFVAFAPLALVFAWSQVDRPTTGRLWGNVRDALDEVDAVDDVAALAGIAQRHDVLLRVVRDDGKVLVDVNDDVQYAPLEGVERFFLGVPPAQRLSEVDVVRGPILERGWVDQALQGGSAIDCDFDYTLLFCEARKLARPHVFVLVTQSSPRGVAEVYRLRRRLLRLALITSPIAILVHRPARRPTDRGSQAAGPRADARTKRSRARRDAGRSARPRARSTTSSRSSNDERSSTNGSWPISSMS